jgi:hypothetical protein
MTEHKASRTLVKSPPELWSECSDAAALARHLGAFGEIKITRLDPETTVAWEGESTSGTVVLEPSGWGTKVTLAVHKGAEPEPVAEPRRPAEPPRLVAQPPPPPPPASRTRVALIWLKAFFLGEPEPELVAAPEPAQPARSVQPAAQPQPERKPEPQLEAALVSALDSLGQAHHRPYSRA